MVIPPRKGAILKIADSSGIKDQNKLDSSDDNRDVDIKTDENSTSVLEKEPVAGSASEIATLDKLNDLPESNDSDKDKGRCCVTEEVTGLAYSVKECFTDESVTSAGKSDMSDSDVR